MRLFFFLFLVPLILFSEEIAITLDDYPMENGLLFSTKERTEKFMSACLKHDCKVVFFCIGKSSEMMGEEIFLPLVQGGHFLANHSMTHEHLSSQSFEDFESEIKKTAQVLGRFKNYRKWFRFPFLDYGNRTSLGGSDTKSQQALKKLKKLGYKDGYVTINTFDWHVNGKLKEAICKGQTIDYEILKKVYLNLIKEWCLFYIDFYRPYKITHTLLLHANDLNALYLDAILQMIKDSNWNIVSPEIAFKNVRWRGKFDFKSLVMPSSLNTEAIDLILKESGAFCSKGL